MRGRAQELCVIPFSVLDLAPIAAGATPADAFRNSLELAQHAEQWGYRRFWLAQHHNMPGISNPATAVVIGHRAGGTKTIPGGAGGGDRPQPRPPGIPQPSCPPAAPPTPPPPPRP